VITLALAIKRVTLSRETGTVQKREVVNRNPDITEEEVYAPFSKLVYDRIMKNERG
jgi:hypothetical protein